MSLGSPGATARSCRLLQKTIVPSSANDSSPSSHMVLIGAPKLWTARSAQLSSPDLALFCPLNAITSAAMTETRITTFIPVLNMRCLSDQSVLTQQNIHPVAIG